jgi:hypothetical protein
MKEELENKQVDGMLLKILEWVNEATVQVIYEAHKDLEMENNKIEEERAYLNDYALYLLGSYTDEEFKELSKKYAGKTKPIDFRELERKE